jgi:hypothetical protein
MPTTPAAPVLTVSQPTQNLTVGSNQPFQISGLVTDRGGTEPIMIDSVTVQIDGGALIEATRKFIPNKTLVEVSFHATAQITSGNDPHTVTVVATNDQGLHATKTVTVFAGTPFQVDTPGVLLDVLSFTKVDPNDPQTLSLIGKIQGQLKSLSDTLASAGAVLIGPNLLVQTVGSGTPTEYLIRIGFWIEAPGFPVVGPTADFPLPRLSDTAAAAAFAATPVLSPPPAGFYPSFALSIPTTTLQHIIDAIKPTLKAQAADQGFALDTVLAQTSSPATVNTNVSGTVLKGVVPASFTISETVGLVAVPDTAQMAPGVTATNSSSSVGSLLDWIVGVFLPLIGAVLLDAFHQVSVAASTKSGVAGGFLGSIPARIPFGNKAFDVPAGMLFPSLNFYWKTFGATSSGLIGTGVTQIEDRAESDVKVTLTGPDSFIGFQNNIIEFTDPIMGFVLENISPDAGKFGWQISAWALSQGLSSRQVPSSRLATLARIFRCL